MSNLLSVIIDQIRHFANRRNFYLIKHHFFFTKCRINLKNGLNSNPDSKFI